MSAAPNIAQQLYAQARIHPVKRENQVASVRMLENRDMEVTQRSGNVFTIPASEREIQAFVIWTIVNPDAS